MTNISEYIIDRDFRINELSNKREIFSNDISNRKRYKHKLKDTLNDNR